MVFLPATFVAVSLVFRALDYKSPSKLTNSTQDCFFNDVLQLESRARREDAVSVVLDLRGDNCCFHSCYHVCLAHLQSEDVQIQKERLGERINNFGYNDCCF